MCLYILYTAVHCADLNLQWIVHVHVCVCLDKLVLGWCNVLVSVESKIWCSFSHYNMFQENVTLLFLWLHRHLLTDFNIIWLYYSWGNLQQKCARLPTTSVYCADTVPCKIMIHLSVFTVFSFVSKNVTPYFLWLLGQMLTNFYNIQ